MIRKFKYNYDINLLDTPTEPKKFNRTILNLETEDIETSVPDIDPQIEITVEEEKPNNLNHSQFFDDVYIYNANTIDGPCYYVFFKLRNGKEEQFLCIDATTPFGPRRLRQTIQHFDDSLFTLYRVKVKMWSLPEVEDIDEDIKLLNDIEYELNMK